ncbi:MAG: N-acetylmuramoyl-L-alanine amidase [Micropepsaceae bacterium]
MQLRRVLFLLLIAWPALAASLAVAAPAIWVSDVRLGQHQDHTRIVLKISGQVEFQAFTLADPYRIVVDFPEIGWRIDPGTTPASAGLVKGFRYGLYKPGRSRMVIDLAGPAAIANRFLLPPERTGGEYRLVLDFVPVDRLTYLSTAGWGPDAEAADQSGQDAEPAALPNTAPANKIPVIVIDPGHGGVDPGATGVSGTHEKDIVLALGKSLADTLRQTGRYKVVLTRDEDIFLSLKARVAVGRRNRADLFISIHADSAPGSTATGASVYTLSEQASDREAEALARSENQSDIIAGVDLTKEADIVTSILIDLAQRETKNNSAKLAQILIPELQKVGNLTHKTHRFAGFRVLKAPDVPSVLIEVGYLTNESDESAMRAARWRRGMTGAIARSVDTYFKRNRREQSMGPVLRGQGG